jgi:hypothetical protein
MMARNGIIRGAEKAWSFNYCKECEEQKWRGSRVQRWPEAKMERKKESDEQR